MVLNFVDGVGVLKGMPPAATAQAEQLGKEHWAMAEGVAKSLILPWPDMPGHFPSHMFSVAGHVCWQTMRTTTAPTKLLAKSLANENII